MTQQTIDQAAPSDRPAERAEILASYYRRALGWARDHGAADGLAGTFARQYTACVGAGSCMRYPDATAPTPAEFADDHALAFGQLTDTTPFGTVIPVGDLWVARCNRCNWNPTASDVTDYATAAHAARSHNADAHPPFPSAPTVQLFPADAEPPASRPHSPRQEVPPVTGTVFTKPSCVQCTATYRALDNRHIDYEIRDVSTDDQALEQVKNLGYLQAPVVLVDGLDELDPDGDPEDHWSGFRPDKISALAARFQQHSSHGSSAAHSA
jgi:glutaredoxin-like protein NrdH